MSLLVNVFIRNENGEITILDAESPELEMAGFESCRTKLYGGHVAYSLRLSLLPSLRENDIYADGEVINLLQHDANLILNNIELFVQGSGLEKAYIQQRIQNILRAIVKAKEIHGGVVIS
jgi:hypothetical protein